MSNSPNNHVAIFASRGGRAASLAISLLIAFASPMAEAQSVADPASNPAMRAPLDIIPTPMREAVGTLAPIAADQDTKLAPRVQARQMNRAMRAVAALPGSQTEIVQVGQLGALADAPVGLQPGYGTALWQGARLAFVTDLMKRLPDTHVLPALRDMERKLHLSATAAPTGSVQGTSWSAARLQRFLDIGDAQSALDLEALTGVAGTDAYAARAKVLAHLAQGDRLAVCAQPAPKSGTQGRRTTKAFFLKVLIYCHLARGDFPKAALAIELNEKTLADDDLFREVAFMLAAQAPVKIAMPLEAEQEAEQDEAGDEAEEDAEIDEDLIVLPAQLTALQVALLQLTGQPLPLMVETLPSYMLTTVASDYAQQPLVQASAGLRAVRFGAAGAAQLAQISQLSDFSAFSLQPLPAFEGDTQPDAIFVTLAVQQVEQTQAEDQPRIIAHYLNEAAQRNLWLDMVHALAPRLRAMALPEPQIQPQEEPLDDAQDAPQDDLQADSAMAGQIEAGVATEDLAVLDNIGDRLLYATADTQTSSAPLSAAPSTDYLPALDLAELVSVLEVPLEMAEASDAEDAEVYVPVKPTLNRADRAILLAAVTVLGETAQARQLLALDQKPSSDIMRRLALLTDDGFLPRPVELAELEEFEAEEFEAEPFGPEVDDAAAPDITLPVTDWPAYERQIDTLPRAVRNYRGYELAVIHGLGFGVPESLSEAFSLMRETPETARWVKLAEDKWIGDLVLAITAHFADKPLNQWSNGEVAALLTALRAADMQDDALAIGRQLLAVQYATLLPRYASALTEGPPEQPELEIAEAESGEPEIREP
jgi:hypothetical protein